ncbi:hypothetical protein KEM52_005040 [Ascosphaera acerosa]|nr:hypothetical protein KEM52_005040 [Ascosphaera acerosa]
MVSGLLWVTMQPQEGLPLDEFHDWYNNEHGPTRLRLPFVENGFRLRAIDGGKKPEAMARDAWPQWLAIYDITDMSELQGESYLRLRRDDVKSQREKDIMPKIKIDRRLFDYVEEVKAEGWTPLEAHLDEPAKVEQPRVCISVVITLKPGQEDEFQKWYREEHMPLLSKVPGFLRIRRFKTSAVGAGPDTPVQWLSMIECTHDATSSPEFTAMNSTPWRNRVQTECVDERSFRTYEHYYTFGPAPRDLAPLDAAKPFVSPDGLTKVSPLLVGGTTADGARSYHAIESFITTSDGADLHYRLEGSSDPDAPLIVLANCILADYSIWDGLLDRFFANDENRTKYRVVRFLARGRTASIGSESTLPITVDTLSSDIVAILDALRVQEAAAVIGVSLGGATALNTALRYPARVRTFIACDTNPVAPANNPAAWAERIELARSSNEFSVAEPKQAIVGHQLAEVTVKRWFVPANYDTAPNNERAQRLIEVVASNNLAGFEAVAHALYAYDLRTAMAASTKCGAFVVGGQDGILPQTMKDMAGMMGGTAEYFVINDAGHLPMVEQPEAFEEVVTSFLARAHAG